MVKLLNFIRLQARAGLGEVSSPLLPEFFTLLGIDVFLAISLLTCLLDKHFPSAIPYVYQLAALIGFGHLLVSKGFLTVFGVEMRFWYSIVYLLVAVANVIAVNVYIAVAKKMSTLALTFSGTVSFPTILLSVFFVSSYSNGMALPLPMLPLIPMEIVYVALAFGAAILGVGVAASLKPETFGKLGHRQPKKKVEEKLTEELTKVLEEVSVHAGEPREIAQSGKPEAVSQAGKPAPSPAPITPRRVRLTPELLIKMKNKEVRK
jgi:hypothetical protein